MAKGDRLYKRALTIANEAEEGGGEEVFKLLSKSASFGNDKALYALATWYLFGRYVEKDYDKAVVFLAKAAEKHNADACHDLAVCFENGQGVDLDLQKAFSLYLKASLLGDKQSIYEVGRMYYYGIGIRKDREVARIWLDAAEFYGFNP